MYPIAGTRRRGLNPDGSINLDLDGRIELELRQDEKEVAEHLMLVDLGRNDIARISAPAPATSGSAESGSLQPRHAPGLPGGGHPSRRP